MPLTIMAIQAAKPRAGTYKLSDGGGLHLEISPAGGKWWRWRYRFEGKEQQLSLGTFPDVPLKDARQRRDDARKLLHSGVNPSQQRQALKAAGATRAANSLEVVAREWHAKQSPGWDAAYAKLILDRLTQNIFPWVGSQPIAELTARDLLPVLDRIQARGAIETAHRCKNHLAKIFRYGVLTGRCIGDPTVGLADALSPVVVKHHPAVTDAAQIGPILRTLDAYSGTHQVKAALRLAPMLLVRPGELRQARWAELDLDEGLWTYFVTKTDVWHTVPLAKQAVDILRELHRLTGKGEYVFANSLYRNRPMSENTVSSALIRMDLQNIQTGHGFRATARTIMDEVLEIRPDFIDHQLAHKVMDPNGRAYNRTKHLRQRREMMQTWADYLDTLRAG